MPLSTLPFFFLLESCLLFRFTGLGFFRTFDAPIIIIFLSLLTLRRQKFYKDRKFYSNTNEEEKREKKKEGRIN